MVDVCSSSDGSGDHPPSLVAACEENKRRDRKYLQKERGLESGALDATASSDMTDGRVVSYVI